MSFTIRLGVSLAIAGLTLAGCSNSNPALLEFAVPTSWYEINEGELSNVANSWSIAGVSFQNFELRAWSVSDRTDAADIFSAIAPQTLQVYEFKRSLTESEIAGLITNPAGFSDLVVPISLRSESDGLSVTTNSIVQIANLQKLEQQLSWDYLGTTQTIFVHAVLDEVNSTLHAVWIRCSDTCIIENQAAVDKLQNSINVVGVN